MLIINDCHLGVSRKSGTTPESRKALEDFQFNQFEDVTRTDGDLCILGDLFDKPNVSLSVIWRTFDILSSYLSNSGFLYLVAGNHDQSNVRGQMSSLDFLARMLTQTHGDRFTYITEPYSLSDEVKVLPHFQNQDLFDLEIKKADEEGCHTLLCHCNYDNHFAVEQDHSLNLSKEQAEKFGTIILAHEHAPRDIKLNQTLVHVLGCQTPTSIADCKTVSEFSATNFDIKTGELKRVPVIDCASLYSEIDWQDLSEEQTNLFIRVTGKATTEEAGKAVQAVSKLRKTSDAFIIANAIEIEGMSCEIDVAEASEEISNLNIVDMLLGELKPWQVSAIKRIQDGEQVDLVREAQC